MSKKICSQCFLVKSYSDFYMCKKNNGRMIPRSVCKECRRGLAKIHYSQNRDKMIKASRNWSTKNRERARQIRDNFLMRNPDYMKKYNTWYQQMKKKGLTPLKDRK